MASIDDISGPALLLDRDALDRNIQAVAKIAGDHGVAWRPHVKAHKCSALGRLQVAAGAIGQSCATLREAEAMAAAGIRGILLTSTLATSAQFERLTKLLRSGADVSVVFDDGRAIDPLADVARKAGIELGVLVDVDVGQNRTGVRDLAQAVVLERDRTRPRGAERRNQGPRDRCRPADDRRRGVGWLDLCLLRRRARGIASQGRCQDERALGAPCPARHAALRSDGKPL